MNIPTGDDTTDRVVAAFELIADEPTAPFDRATVTWRCSTCHEYVIDDGPHHSHPVRCEHGHAEDCARHQAETAAYEAKRGD